MKRCPLCGIVLVPLFWGDNDTFIDSDDIEEVVGFAECKACRIVWRIDYSNNDITINSFRKKCEEVCSEEQCQECFVSGAGQEVFIVNDSQIGDKPVWFCDFANDVKFEMKIDISRKE